MATHFSQWLPQNFNQQQFNPTAQTAAAALGPQPQPQQQPQTQTPPPKNPWWNPFGIKRYGSAAEASGALPAGPMPPPPPPQLPATAEQAQLLPDFTNIPPPPEPPPPPPLPMQTGSPFPDASLLAGQTSMEQSIASGQPQQYGQQHPQQPQLQFQPSLTQPGQGLVPQGGQDLAQQMQQVLGPERLAPTPPYIQPTPTQGPQVNQQPPPQPATTAYQPPPVPVGQTVGQPPSFGQPQPPPPGGQQQPGQTFFSPANALAGDQPLPPAGQGTPLDLTPAGLQEGMGNIRTATNIPRQEAIAAAQAAIARGETPAEPGTEPVPAETKEQIIPGIDLAEKAPVPPEGAPLYDEKGNPLPLPGVPREDMLSIRRAPEEDFTAVQVEETLAAEEEAPVEVLEEPTGAMTAVSSFLDNPQVQMAMFQAAKALDPKGFGGTLAVGMEPVLKGKDYQSYVSDLLSGKAPEEITSGTILSPKEKATAIKQYQGQQLVDKAESPLQKLYRDIAKAATAGEYGMAVAKTRIVSEMAKAMNASVTAKNKKEVTEAFKAISDVRGKISMDIMSADGTLNQSNFMEAMLGGQQIMTPGDKEALKAAVKYLEDNGYETLGMRSLLDATDNLTQPAAPVTTNPLAPDTAAAAVEGPESVEAGVASGALTDHGDGTYTVNVPGHALNGQKVKVGEDGELRTL